MKCIWKWGIFIYYLDFILFYGEMKILIVCEVGFYNVCKVIYSIEVKYCIVFLVYKFKLLDGCNFVYCFGIWFCF